MHNEKKRLNSLQVFPWCFHVLLKSLQLGISGVQTCTQLSSYYVFVVHVSVLKSRQDCNDLFRNLYIKISAFS